MFWVYRSGSNFPSDVDNVCFQSTGWRAAVWVLGTCARGTSFPIAGVCAGVGFWNKDMCGCLWMCIYACGYTGIHVDACGHVGTCGCVYMRVDTCGRVWMHVDTCGCVLVCGCMCTHVDTCMWVGMDVCKCMWLHVDVVDVSGYVWICRYVWIHVCGWAWMCVDACGYM